MCGIFCRIGDNICNLELNNILKEFKKEDLIIVFYNILIILLWVFID